jgi:hypothetical protein
MYAFFRNNGMNKESINSIKQNPPSEANSMCSSSRNTPSFMEPRGSLPCSQEPATSPRTQQLSKKEYVNILSNHKVIQNAQLGYYPTIIPQILQAIHQQNLPERKRCSKSHAGTLTKLESETREHPRTSNNFSL